MTCNELFYQKLQGKLKQCSWKLITGGNEIKYNISEGISIYIFCKIMSISEVTLSKLFLLQHRISRKTSKVFVMMHFLTNCFRTVSFLLKNKKSGTMDDKSYKNNLALIMKTIMKNLLGNIVIKILPPALLVSKISRKTEVYIYYLHFKVSKC